MNRITVASLLVLLILGFSNVSQAQFRAPLPDQAAADAPRPAVEVIRNGEGDSFFSRLFDPSRWSDHSMYSFQYSTFSGGSVGLGMYTNSLQFQAADNVRLTADVSAVYSPYSSFGNDYAKSLNGVYLSDARLDWQLGPSTSVVIQYIGGPGPNTPPFYYYDRIHNPLLR